MPTTGRVKWFDEKKILVLLSVKMTTMYLFNSKPLQVKAIKHWLKDKKYSLMLSKV